MAFVRVALKIAILKTDGTQRAYAMRVGVPEVRLSLLIRGKVDPTSEEIATFSSDLHQPAAVLFRRVRTVNSRARSATSRP